MKFSRLVLIFTLILFFLFFPRKVFAQEVSVDAATRTVENSYIKIKWDEEVAEKISEFYFKPFSSTQNLTWFSRGEVFGNSAAHEINRYGNIATFVSGHNVDNSWSYTWIGSEVEVRAESTSTDGFRVHTTFTIKPNNPSVLIERSFGFGSNSIGPSRILAYFVRAHPRTSFTHYAWETIDGSVETSSAICEFGCTPTNWNQTWIDVYAPDLGVGLGIYNLNSNPISTPWLDRDANSHTAFITAVIPTEGYSEDLSVSYLLIPHLGDHTSVDWETGLSQTTPESFLNLPWDYEGMSFRDAALTINSYFDHEYPLLSVELVEPSEAERSVKAYDTNISTSVFYSGHDGYDWGRRAGAEPGDYVLAAASGVATYKGDCGACGNAILIDHGNGYQTRYYHLSSSELVVNQAGESVFVNQGQQIGRVGYSGNVIPSGERGAHIHFMVVEDKDGDGVFDDNIPDGVTDPFGWMGNTPDPWASYGFKYGDEDGDGELDDHTGNDSHYLWLGHLFGFSGLLTRSELNVIVGDRYTYNFPPNSFPDDVFVEELGGPSVMVSELVESIASASIIRANDLSGNPITNLLSPFTLVVDFAGFDLTRFDTDTLAIYSSEDGVVWQQEETQIDMESRTATAQIDHLSHFALMAERVDTTAPTTTPHLSGEEGESGWFRSNVELNLAAEDNPGGLGVDYTVYKVNDGEWQEYAGPAFFADEGEYAVEYYSVDYDENIEEVRSLEFNIDKTTPEALVQFNPDTSRAEIVAIDNQEAEVTMPATEDWFESILITDRAGNTLELLGRFKFVDNLSMLRIDSLVYKSNQEYIVNDNYYNSRIKTIKDNVKLTTQAWSLKDDVLVKISYRDDLDQSIIYISRPDEQDKWIERDSLSILSIQTDNGNLEYSYE